MSAVRAVITAFDRVLCSMMRWMIYTCLVGLLLILSAVVFVRFVPISSMGWSDEIVEGAFAWMVFVGAAVLWRDNEHFRVMWLEDQLKGTIAIKVIRLAVEIISLIFIGVMTYYGWHLMVSANDRSPILELPRYLWYFCIPLSGLIMTGYSCRNIISAITDINNSIRTN